MMTTRGMLLADECWVALALLHRAEPQRVSFSAREILDRLKQEKAHPEVRAGVQAHIYQHNVANTEPSSARYRMFYRLDDGTYRLYRPGDHTHPARKGKTMPDPSVLPVRYRDLLDWYRDEYCLQGAPAGEGSDPVLQMRGVGKRIRQDRSIRRPDAMQLACAAMVGIDLFLTNDAKLSQKVVPGIQFIASLERAPL